MGAAAARGETTRVSVDYAARLARSRRALAVLCTAVYSCKRACRPGGWGITGLGAEAAAGVEKVAATGDRSGDSESVRACADM